MINKMTVFFVAVHKHKDF